MQVLCALFAAFCAVCSQLTIPIQPVPITLGTFAVLLAGGFLGSRYGLMSIVIYLLLGAAGVPVFSMMRSGVSVIAGPAGGVSALHVSVSSGRSGKDSVGFFSCQ